jgi:hypothetical protein
VGFVCGKKGYAKTLRKPCKLFTRKYKKDIIDMDIWDIACDDRRQIKMAHEC